MTALIFLNNDSSFLSTQSGGGTVLPQPPPTSELSASASASILLHPLMDGGEPHSDGKFHYEGIGHNVLEPHIISGSSGNGSSNGNNIVSTSSTTSHNNAAVVVVPFSIRYNIYFDGLLFIKNETHSHSQQDQKNEPNIFNSYAKTLDPVTEIHFSPGESTTTKQIILSTVSPPDDLSTYSNIGINNDQQFLSSSMLDIEKQQQQQQQNSVLTIGLQSNGKLWLPRSNNDNDNDEDGNNNVLYHDDDNNKEMMYVAGDQFVLKIMDENDDSSISSSMIRLYRNNNEFELISEWKNLYHDDNQKLYAQIWFKDPKSSMIAYALNNNNEDSSKQEEEDDDGNTNGQNYRQLRGRKDYF